MFEPDERLNYKYALRTIRYERSVIANICDFELVGRQVRSGDHIISLTREYFLEELISQSEAKNILKSSSILNLVGNRIINLAIDMKLAKQITVKNIQGVPFLMIFKFQHSTG